MKRHISTIITGVLVFLGFVLFFTIYKNDYGNGTVFFIAWASLIFSLSSSLNTVFVKEKLREVEIVRGKSLDDLKKLLSEKLKELEGEKSVVESVQIVDITTAVIVYFRK